MESLLESFERFKKWVLWRPRCPRYI